MSESSSQTINKWLLGATRKLEAVGIATARLDCLVLLEDTFGKDRTQLLAHDDQKLNTEQLRVLDLQVGRRSKHEPLAYIRGKSEFYGREFIVNKHTLEPRPETETIIDLLKELITASQKPSLLKIRSLTEEKNVNWRIGDVGTGSGCIGITVKLEAPEVEVVGTDIAEECLKVAKQNAKKLGADVRFYKGHLLETVKDQNLDILVCNLPYVPDGHTINQAAMQEPELAIFGGPDGLGLYRKLFEQIKNHNISYGRSKSYSSRPAYVLTESLPFQHQELVKIAQKHGFKLAKTDDFIQVFKLVDS